MKLNKKTYINFIKNTISTDGIKVADAANKLALEQKAISIDVYLEAAQIIVNAFLANE